MFMNEIYRGAGTRHDGHSSPPPCTRVAIPYQIPLGLQGSFPASMGVRRA
jgi:hypothetical protein